MKPSARVTVDTTIESLAPGGDGVAKLERDGERRAVFVRGVAPGDRVTLDVDLSSRPARGEVTRLLEASADRAAPPCAYAAICGGCDWMHVSLDAQRRIHASHVQAALPKEWRAFAITSHEASAPLGYRSRARVHVRVSGGRAIVGMNEARSREPVEVNTCVVMAEPLDRARASLEALFANEHGRADVQLALAANGRVAIDVRWSGALSGGFYGRVERAMNDASGVIAGARIFAGESTKPSIIGDPSATMIAADGAPLTLAAGGFAQASQAENARLASRVAELAASALAATQRTEPARVVELYAGAGNLTVLLAKLTTNLLAVESDRDACEAARKNLTSRSLRAKVVEADAAKFEIARATDLVVLDPPRAGAREVAERLVKEPAKHLIYVSCDPQTLGRDLAILAPRYEPLAIETFEMFPQTSHVETVIALKRVRPQRGDA